MTDFVCFNEKVSCNKKKKKTLKPLHADKSKPEQQIQPQPKPKPI